MTNYIEFATKIKEKYPEYKEVDDLVLAQKMVEKYPEYKETITFEEVKPEKKGIDLTPSGAYKKAVAQLVAPLRALTHGQTVEEAYNTGLDKLDQFKPAKGAGDFLFDMAIYSKIPWLKNAQSASNLAKVGTFAGNAALQGGVPAALESLKRGGSVAGGASAGTGIAALLQTIPHVSKVMGGVGNKAFELSGKVGQIKPETLRQVIKPESKALEMSSEDATNALLDITKQIRSNFDALSKTRGQAVNKAVEGLGENSKRFDIKDLLNDVKSTFDQYQRDLVNPARHIAGGLEGDLTKIINSGTENPAPYYKYAAEKVSPYFSKDKQNEAFRILSEATGEPVNWLKSQLNANTFDKGVGARKEFIENLLGNTDDKLAALGKDYFNDLQFYKPQNLDDITAGAELARQAFDDIVNRNFNIYTDDALTRALNQADNGYKELLSKIAQNPRNEEVYTSTYPELQKIIKDLPSDLQEKYTSDFFEALDDIYNKANTVSPLSLQGIKETIGKLSKWGDETSRGYAEPITQQIYGKLTNRLSELSPEIKAANKSFSDLMNYKKNDTVGQILKGDLLSEGKLGAAPRALKSYKSSVDKASGAKNLKDLENLLVRETEQQPFLNQIDDINAAMDLLKTETTGFGGVAGLAKSLLTRPVLSAVRGANRAQLPEKMQALQEMLAPIGKLMPALGAKGASNLLYGGVSYDNYK